MKLWLDDVRLPPDGWDWKVTASEAIEALKTGKYTQISFDHDLGDPHGLENLGTGYEVAAWIEEQAYFGQIKRLIWKIHSANPVGRRNIEAAMINADKFWSSDKKPGSHTETVDE